MLRPIEGNPPDLLNPPEGCPFCARCDKALKICKKEMPPYFINSDEQRTACWLCYKGENNKINEKGEVFYEQ